LAANILIVLLMGMSVKMEHFRLMACMSLTLKTDEVDQASSSTL